MFVRKKFWLAALVAIALILSACNLGATPAPTQDIGAIQTQAMGAVATQLALQQTQTAAAAPPTSLPSFTPLVSATAGTGTPFTFNTPLAGFTPLASPIPTIAVGTPNLYTANGCNDGLYMGETAPYDRDNVKADKEFSKTWQIRNTGTCAWDQGYTFVFLKDISTPGLDGYDININNNSINWTNPGHDQSFVVKIVAPNKSGEYKGYWKLRDDSGNFFGPQVYLWVLVPD